MRITKENTIGLVIDIQERLFPVMWEKENLLKNCAILLNGLKELSLPTIVTQQYTKGLGETLQEIKATIADFNYVEKRDFSCCDELKVAEKLKVSGAENVIICGIESHVCVLQTAVDLKEAGLNPVVVMDCVSSRSKESIDIAKERFRYERIMMTSYESILFELTRTAGAPEFRAISKLVK
ncbi:isochorismatase family protein [Maribellus maritimus]|uniref:isochorismatase family protein n=1 Tax=Maribellus maritimus TaxID=2870838 RepID=UPI001EEAE8A3|nr:isochorismatase family protein [Maribellus maritimus]MCG6185968.1 isochorismatase family protein [Maribellus maritimus]